jgi:hypothetical protein
MLKKAGVESHSDAKLLRAASDYLEQEAERYCRVVVDQQERGEPIEPSTLLAAGWAVIRVGPRPRNPWLRGQRPFILGRVAELAVENGVDPLPFDQERSMGTDETRVEATAAFRRLRRVVLHPQATPTMSVSPDAIDRATEATAAVDSDVIERVAERAAEKAVEAMGARAEPDTLNVKLPELDSRDTEAWQASIVAGMTQAKIADELNRKYAGENWTQPRVSEAIKRAKAHAEASGLAGKVSAARSRAPARTLDPAAAEQGKRTDGKAHHLRERERQKAKDGDDEE